MVKKYFSIVKNRDLTNIKAKLISTFGLPEISKKLSVYAFNGNNDEIHIEFKGKDKYITYLSSGDDHALIKNNKFIFKNLKAFLKLIHRLGFNECSTGEIIENIFKRNRIEITISNNTFIGNILSFEARTLETKKIIEKILGKNYKIEEAGSIGKYTKELEIPRKPLINHFNVVNEDIVKYADSVGLDIRSFESTLQSKIESFSNDYSS
ncbi:hypothetical protein CO178_00045 [candidate division WWE3 bacterium CG_4_9_14_3_um_filter_34_6]|uniref:CYTH domain-containing protein n=1 Tax=candidate division WWE3 bacterium CG_4_9_14_3_um_filter_34_6 TaxID=1975079 RepID=A0A2M7X5L9_UNCKA|nr:MAG: hypothetical protein CO178_00045 [candidate division WWE3 bacterium CG_4_9_14_3_um_filter_34_6]